MRLQRKNELALFSGAGGGLLGSVLLGWSTVCAVERDEYAASVLVSRQNDGSLEPFPIWDDIKTFNAKQWRGVVDVVSGGFPCQAFSTATHGRNTAEDLWHEMFRVVSEVQPREVFAENVSRKAIDKAADDLESLGYRTKAVALSAKDLGADHARKRYWLRAYTNDDGELRQSVDAEAPMLSEFRPGVWETYSGESRVVDGMGFRLERLKATGNGQVPCVAAAAWRILGGR